MSISFWTAAGVRVELPRLRAPMTFMIGVKHPNATCSYWDEEDARWSSRGVATLSVDASLTCSTSHLTIFGGPDSSPTLAPLAQAW